MYSTKTNEILSEIADYSFNFSNLSLVLNGDSLIDLIELIGVPRFLGVLSTQSLDFGNSDSDIHRAFFSNDIEYSNVEILDYSHPNSWLDQNKLVLPTLSDLENIEIGMSLDEVVSILGKPQGSVGYGSIMFPFLIDDGSTLLTSWNPGEYSNNGNGPYFGIVRLGLNGYQINWFK